MKIIDITRNRLDEVFGIDNYHLIALAITGSHAYGCNTADSDFDIMGIYLPPVEYILGLKSNEHIEIPKTPVNKTTCEGTLYSFSKWYKLYVDQNPNIIEMLWHVPSQYVYTDDIYWNMLIKNRNELLSKKAKHSFSGYAHSQLVRLDSLNKNINQNPKRLERFHRFGYDTKNAMHMLRLLNTAMEILVEHKVNVMRPETAFLLSVLEGEFNIQEIKKMALEKEHLLEEAYIRSDLRKQIDDIFANNLKIEIMKKYIGDI